MASSDGATMATAKNALSKISVRKGAMFRICARNSAASFRGSVRSALDIVAPSLAAMGPPPMPPRAGGPC